MRTMRLIAAIVILCVGMAGQGDAQKQDKKTDAELTAESLALTAREMARQEGIAKPYLDAYWKCLSDKDDTSGRAPCDVYSAMERQTTLEDLLPMSISTRLKASSTERDIRMVEYYMRSYMRIAYNHGRQTALEEIRGKR